MDTGVATGGPDRYLILMAPSFSLGDMLIDPALVLAPMSGVTDMAFRRLIRELNPGAVGLTVSEFVSIEGLTRKDLRSQRMLTYHPDEHPISIQIFGADADRMAEAAAMVQATGVDVLDINCGCPVPKVVRRGGGADLMRQTDRLEKMLRAVKRELSIPLTLKVRAGWDENSINAPEIAQMAESCGVEMMGVHGRTRVQLYKGAADWDVIRSVKEAVDIPVLGSGDVVSVATARKRWEVGGVDGLLIGRGAMENPWIFTQLATDLAGGTAPTPTLEDRFAALRRYYELLLESYPEKTAAPRLRGMGCRTLKSFPGSAILRDRVGKSRTAEELFQLLEDFLDYRLRKGHAAA
jgi:tRNA-dihydrouridine synthase B